MSDDKKAAAAEVEAQNQNFIVLFLLTVCLNGTLFFSFSPSKSLRVDVFYFEAIVYLLGEKLV